MNTSKKNALFFYARPETEDFSGKTRIGKVLHNQPWANAFAKALITDMYTQYNRPGSSYDLYTPIDLPSITYDAVEIGMQQIFQKLLASYEKVIIVGSDIPSISHDIIESSFVALKSHAVTIIPTIDKGYGLIGMNSFVDVFTDIKEWKSRAATYDLAKETIALAKTKDIDLFVQKTVFDIDEVDDISLLAENIQAFPYMRKTATLLSQSPIPYSISIIIPSYNEETRIEQSIKQLDTTHQVIVVDGGSKDKTTTLAKNMGATIYTSTGGRGPALRTGAAQASHDILLFLHADTQLPDNWANTIRTAIQQGAIGGAFHLSFTNTHWFYTACAAYANMRASIFQTYHGDQAMFVTRRTYHEIEGIPDVPLMEDVILSKRMKRAGKTILLPLSVGASDRRIDSYGKIKSILRYFLMKTLFYFGASPAFLTRIYK